MSAERTTFWRLEPRPNSEPARLGSVPRWPRYTRTRRSKPSPSFRPATRRHTLRPGLATVALDDVGPCQVVVAVRAADPNRSSVSWTWLSA